MNKKNFFSILISGKLGLSLISGIKAPTSSAFTVSQCVNQPFNISLSSSSPGVEYTADSYGSPTINVLIPGTGCTYATPTEIDLVITGVVPRDEVYIGAAATKDDPTMLSYTQNKVRLGSDFKLLGWFSIAGYTLNNVDNTAISNLPLGYPLQMDLQNSGTCILVPITLPQDLYSVLGQEFYIQTISFPNGSYNWNDARVSDLVKIKIDVKTCSTY